MTKALCFVLFVEAETYANSKIEQGNQDKQKK